MWSPSSFMISVGHPDDGSQASIVDHKLLGLDHRQLVENFLAEFPNIFSKPTTIKDLEAAVSRTRGSEGRLVLHSCMSALIEARLLYVTDTAEQADFRFYPLRIEALHKVLIPPAEERELIISRFTLMRPQEARNGLVLECPRALGYFEIYNADAAATAAHTLAMRALHFKREPDDHRPHSNLLRAGLHSAGFLTRTGTVDIDQTVAAEHPYWEFHDYHFHTRSRLGRHRRPVGATYRMAQLDPLPPAVRPPHKSIARFELPKNNNHPPATDPSLWSVMDRRRSMRHHSPFGLSRQEFGEFLYRCCAVREKWQNEVGEFTRRPYPSGGGSYDLEIYFIVSRMHDLPTGFYHYSPMDHSAHLLQHENELSKQLIKDAFNASAGTCYPNVLIMLASRYKRVSWKYSGIAYATILKNVGVLYANMYLVATAMALAPCALGLGDPEKFSKLTGLDFLEEGTVGEFVLGCPL